MSTPAPTSRPFTFDTVFEGGAVLTPVRPKRVFTLEEVEAIRMEAFAAGERSATAQAEQAAAAALAEAAHAVRQGLGALTRVAHDHRGACAELALTAGRKIADAALERFPEAAAAAAMTAMARELEASPRLVVRSAAADPVRLEAALTGAANTAGYAGQLVFKSEPGMATGAFSFDWGDGRASFDPLASAARIEAALHAALAAEGLHAEPLSLNGDAP